MGGRGTRQPAARLMSESYWQQAVFGGCCACHLAFPCAVPALPRLQGVEALALPTQCLFCVLRMAGQEGLECSCLLALLLLTLGILRLGKASQSPIEAHAESISILAKHCLRTYSCRAVGGLGPLYVTLGKEMSLTAHQNQRCKFSWELLKRPCSLPRWHSVGLRQQGRATTCPVFTWAHLPRVFLLGTGPCSPRLAPFLFGEGM